MAAPERVDLRICETDPTGRSILVHNRTREYRMRLRLIVGAVALLVGFSSGSAYAGIAYSAWGTAFTGAGKSYQGRSYINTDPGVHATAGAAVRSNSGNVAAGWLGGQPRRATATGTIQCIGSWGYSSTLSSYRSFTGCRTSTRGSYSGHAVVRGWNGSGYTTRTAPRSPAQTN